MSSSNDDYSDSVLEKVVEQVCMKIKTKNRHMSNIENNGKAKAKTVHGGKRKKNISANVAITHFDSTESEMFFIDKRKPDSIPTVHAVCKEMKTISKSVNTDRSKLVVSNVLPKVAVDHNEVMTFVIDTNPVNMKSDDKVSDIQFSSMETSQSNSQSETLRNLKNKSEWSLYSHGSSEDEDTIIDTKGTRNKRCINVATLQSSIDPSDTYINVDALTKPANNRKKLEKMLLGSDKDHEIMKKSVVTADFEKKEAIPPYKQSLYQLKKQRKKVRDMTKGKEWFDMPASELTEERKNDLMVLQMRHALDPKRFYKANDMKALPKYFQFGTIVESKADFYSSRVPKKDRKKTMVDELLADADQRRFNKRKYAEIQEAKHLGQGPYQRVKFPRRKKFNQKKKK